MITTSYIMTVLLAYSEEIFCWLKEVSCYVREPTEAAIWQETASSQQQSKTHK